MELTASLQSVGKSYQAPGGQPAPVLDGVDLTIEPGQRLVLGGRSGSGKSTLIRLIAGLEAVDAGVITVCGRAMSASGAEARAALRARHLGIIFQDYNLVPSLTVSENLRFPLALNGLSAGSAEIAAWLRRVDLAGFEDRFPERLSGGEKQRVAVARALIHRPDLILADEPTAALDAVNAREVMALLTAAAIEQGASLLLVSHAADASEADGERYQIVDRRLTQMS